MLIALTQSSDREQIKACIQAAGTPLYTTDSAYPGRIIEVRADGTRAPGRLQGRQFVADPVNAKRVVHRGALSKIQGRRRMRLSGVTVAWRGTPNIDDWVAYVVNGMRSKKLILADHSSERCGGRRRLIATLHDPAVIRTILAHLGIAHAGPSPGPAPPALGAAAP